jgi:hypothetical protein
VVEASWLQPEKGAVGAAERDEFLRCAWRVMVAEKVDQKRLVFVDEMGANTSLSPLYAYSPKGERAHVCVLLVIIVGRTRRRCFLEHDALWDGGPSLWR